MSGYKFTLPLPSSTPRRDERMERLKRLMPNYVKDAGQQAAYSSRLAELQNQRDNIVYAAQNGTFEQRIQKAKNLGHLNEGGEAMARELEGRRVQTLEESNSFDQAKSSTREEFTSLVEELESNLRGRAYEIQKRVFAAFVTALEPYCETRKEAENRASLLERELYIFHAMNSFLTLPQIRDFESRAKQLLNKWEQLSPYFTT